MKRGGTRAPRDVPSMTLVITGSPLARVTASGISREQRDRRRSVMTRLKRRENEAEVFALRKALDRRGS